MILVAAGFSVFAAQFSKLPPEQQHWQTANGHVTKVDWHLKTRNVTIAFDLAGKTYSRTDRFTPILILMAPKAGEKIVVRYDPAHPQTFLREPGLWNGSLQLYLASAALIILGAVPAVASAFRSSKDADLPEAKT